MHDQLLHPAFRAVYEQFLTTEASTGEGEGKYTLHADPLLSSAIVFRIDPGARAQELHRVIYASFPFFQLCYLFLSVSQLRDLCNLTLLILYVI